MLLVGWCSAARNRFVKQVHAWGNGIPEDTLTALMNSNDNVRNFGGNDTLELAKCGLNSTDAKVLANMLRDNTTVTKVGRFFNINTSKDATQLSLFFYALSLSMRYRLVRAHDCDILFCWSVYVAATLTRLVWSTAALYRVLHCVP